MGAVPLGRCANSHSPDVGSGPSGSKSHWRGICKPAYRGAARVVYGHTPTDAPAWINGTLCIDTGCVYGGALTALRYPELELVSVAARRVHTTGP